MKQLFIVLFLLSSIFTYGQQTNEEKALAVLAAFESGDSTVLDFISDAHQYFILDHTCRVLITTKADYDDTIFFRYNRLIDFPPAM